jgi:hypothetical protein
MSFWKKLFGGGALARESSAPAKSIDYNGFTIRAEPYLSEGHYQVAGVIEKEIGGERKQHKFIRADRHPSRDDAVEIALAKGRLIVDEQGERMFR